MTVVPFTYFIGAEHSSLARLAKLTKLYRLIRMIKLFRMLKMIKESDKIVMFLNSIFKLRSGFERLFYFALIMLLFCHSMGCFWYFVAKMDGFDPSTWIVRYGFIDES